MDLYIHIGYHKTATTSLQKHIFNNLSKQVNYLGRNYNDNNKFDFFKFIRARKNLDCDSWVKKFNLEYDDILIKNISDYCINGKKNLISHENFLRPFSYKDLPLKLSKLKNFGFKVNIIVSIRNQNTLIPSRYFHDLNIFERKHGFYFLKDVLNDKDPHCYWPYCQSNCSCKIDNKKIINLNFYKYGKLLNDIHDKLNHVKIHIIQFENLVEKPEMELSKIAKFMNISIDNDFLVNQMKSKAEGKRADKEKGRIVSLNGDSWADCIKAINEYYEEDNLLLKKFIID